MGHYEYEESKEAKQGPHPDYWRNLAYSVQFVENCTNKLSPGMKVYISDSHGMTKNLLMIAFLPASDAPMGNCCNPVNMHQSSKDFKEEVKSTFNHFSRMAKKNVLKAKILDNNRLTIPRQPKQDELDFLAG